MNGRPLTIGDVVNDSEAVIEAWYPGEEGGRALADIIFGNVNPSGKLYISFPKNVGQIPVYYNHKPSARGRFYKKPFLLISILNSSLANIVKSNKLYFFIMFLLYKKKHEQSRCFYFNFTAIHDH